MTENNKNLLKMSCFVTKKSYWTNG